MKGAIIFGILAGWAASETGREREVELLTLAVFGPLLLKAQLSEERPRPLWATQMMAVGGAAAVTYRLIGLTR